MPPFGQSSAGQSNLVAICLPAPEAVRSVRECWDRGDAAFVVDPSSPSAKTRRLLEMLAPTHVLDESGESRLAHGKPLPEGIAAVVATSGTTGEPRLVALSYYAVEASAQAVTKAIGADAGDRWLLCLPLHHVAGLAVVARSHFCGAGLEVAGRFAPDAFEHTSKRCSLVSLVPTALARLLRAQTPLDRFRRILVGGSPCPSELLEQAAGVGANVVTTYGLTETGGGCVHGGEAMAGVDVSLAPDGEVLVRGPVLMSGYVEPARRDPAGRDPSGRAPQAGVDLTYGIELTHRGVIGSGGWLQTGDLGSFDPSGRLVVTDRKDDVINTGGVNVSPTIVESELAEHPLVEEVAIAGLPDDEWGERVTAFVVPTDRRCPPSLEDLQGFAAARLTKPELPRAITYLRSLPRSQSGKLLRRVLRDGTGLARLDGPELAGPCPDGPELASPCPDGQRDR